MKIEYLGHACFRITLQNGTTILTDPYTNVGYELPNGIQADIVTVSHSHFDHNFVAGVTNAKVVLDGLGEYDFDGLKIVGKESWHDNKKGALRGKNILYTFFAEDLSICHLGDLGEDISKEILQKIGKVDILLIPVGGTYTIDPRMAKAYIDEIAPKIAVPMHYRPKDGVIDVLDASVFLSLFNGQIDIPEEETGFVVDKESLAKNTKIVFLQRR